MRAASKRVSRAVAHTRTHRRPPLPKKRT
jgi:hypothetical protein